MARNIPGFKIGSYVPDSNRWEVYLNEMAIGPRYGSRPGWRQ
jgi:hypothetical protein